MCQECVELRETGCARNAPWIGWFKGGASGALAPVPLARPRKRSLRVECGDGELEPEASVRLARRLRRPRRHSVRGAFAKHRALVVVYDVRRT